MLKFSFGNSKLIHGQVIFDLVAGYSCPFAKLCLAFADRITGKITDGPDTIFRCYHASCETRPSVRAAHWFNFDAVREAKTRRKIFKLIKANLPLGLVYRVHSGGDYFSQAYFDAWMDIARAFPDRIFYSYTKALPYWIKRKRTIPKNFKLVASYGGTHDYLIEKHNLRYCKVVMSYAEAESLQLVIDKDDSHCWNYDKSFAVLIHGTQPAGTPASKAWYSLCRKSGYGPNHKEGLWNG